MNGTLGNMLSLILLWGRWMLYLWLWLAIQISERCLDSLIQQWIIFILVWNLVINIVEGLIVAGGGTAVIGFILLVEYVVIALWNINVQTVV